LRGASAFCQKPVKGLKKGPTAGNTPRGRLSRYVRPTAMNRLKKARRYFIENRKKMKGFGILLIKCRLLWVQVRIKQNDALFVRQNFI
jgi:hypothetical protein